MSENNIYVLKLERGRYYIGRSTCQELRYIQHTIGKGSSWTSKYPPISVHEIRPSTNPFEEDMVTKEYMAKYGIENVRGGSYVKIILDSIQLEAITRELRSVRDLCNACGESCHFIRECPQKLYSPVKKKDSIIWLCEYCRSVFSYKDLCVEHEALCSRRTPPTIHPL